MAAEGPPPAAMTADATSLEDRWLDYAVDVVTATDHDCRAHGGGCLEPSGDPSLRWPGYLGERMRSGSLLLVGNVHRDFGSNATAPWVSALLVDTTRRLLADPVDHREQYLADIRRAYLEGLGGGGKRGSWKVATPFSYLLGDLQLGWRDIAYTNASKSQAVPGTNISALITACTKRFPIDRLASTLDVSSIVVCSAPVRDHLLDQGIDHEYFPQRGWSRDGLRAIADRCRQRLPQALREAGLRPPNPTRGTR